MALQLSDLIMIERGGVLYQGTVSQIAALLGGGGVSPGGSSGEIQYNSGGAFAGAADVEVENGQLRLPAIVLPTAPAAGGVKLFSSNRAGTPRLAFMMPTSTEGHFLQPLIGNGSYMLFLPAGGTVVTNVGVAVATGGTATNISIASGSRYGRLQKLAYRITTAAATAIAFWRHSVTRFTVGGSQSWEGGFDGVMHGGPDTGANIATHRFFMGLRDSAAPTDVNPSTFTSMVGIGYDSADTQVQFLHNDGSGVATKIPLGVNFPKPTVASTNAYRLRLYSPPGTTRSVSYEVLNLANGAEATGTITTDLPATNFFMAPVIYASVGGTSSVVGVMVGPIMFQTED